MTRLRGCGSEARHGGLCVRARAGTVAARVRMRVHGRGDRRACVMAFLQRGARGRSPVAPWSPCREGSPARRLKQAGYQGKTEKRPGFGVGGCSPVGSAAVDRLVQVGLGAGRSCRGGGISDRGRDVVCVFSRFCSGLRPMTRGLREVMPAVAGMVGRGSRAGQGLRLVDGSTRRRSRGGYGLRGLGVAAGFGTLRKGRSGMVVTERHRKVGSLGSGKAHRWLGKSQNARCRERVKGLDG